jgi:hypothetical protein
MKIMKTSFSPSCALVVLALLAPASAPAANPDVGAAIVRQFGEAQLRNVVLVKASPNETDPIQWKVYSRDPYREGELLRTIATKMDGKWDAAPAGAGKLLQRVPRLSLDFKRLKVDSKEARRIITEAARLAQVDFTKVDYQLAANDQTGSPEWGLALQDATGYEAGFCVVSGETGALLSQDWTPRYANSAAAKPGGKPKADTRTPAQKEGEEAAKRVKQGVRRAWDWTEEAGKKTGSFFRELFR